MSLLVEARRSLHRTPLVRRYGLVRKMHGLAVVADGPHAAVGELCAILPADSSGGKKLAAARMSSDNLLAEVVAVHAGQVTLMPYGTVQGLSTNSVVVAMGSQSEVGVGANLLGRVIDCFGQPLDGKAAPVLRQRRPLRSSPRNPMGRPRITHPLETGIRTIDSLLTLGRGQRMGIFAGSGVGKSTLLGMIARHVKADVNVIALIGERGREVRDFIEKQLDLQAMQRSVVVVATADQPALARLRAAYAAVAIAEDFRNQGLHVVLTMDSVTRFAMAKREVGLSAGEPPTARGYTPSVFAELPELFERCGTASSGGSITALLTVLVEGDDLNEPISDALRAILDGHIVLSRHIAHQGQYPAIDVLKSASRLMPDLTSPAQRETVKKTVQILALLERNHQMVELGAYERGSNPQLDSALTIRDELLAWLGQSQGGAPWAESWHQLDQIVGGFSGHQLGAIAPRGAAR
jgi:flagellum-specific ATP synthase